MFIRFVKINRNSETIDFRSIIGNPNMNWQTLPRHRTTKAPHELKTTNDFVLYEFARSIFYKRGFTVLVAKY